MVSPSTGAPPALPASALSLELEAFVAIRAAAASGLADVRATFECTLARAVGGGGGGQGEGYARDGFLVFAGLDPLLDALERLRLRRNDLDWLASTGVIDAETRARLAELRFACDVDAAPEGSVVFAGEPVLTVEGPYWQAQLVSGLVERALTHATIAATATARCALAAGGAELLDAGASTTLGFAGSPLLARASFVGGAHATTCALAGRRHGIPVRALQPARWSIARSDDAAALASWLDAAPQHAIVRIDEGAHEASIAAAVSLMQRRQRSDTWDPPHVALGISGDDVVAVARRALALFAEASLRAPLLVVADDCDEAQIAELRREEPRLGCFAIDAYRWPGRAALARYELVAVEESGRWSPRGASPGRKMLLRYFDEGGRPVADVAHAAGERFPPASELGAATSAPLLANVMRAGRRVAAGEPPRVTRERAAASVRALHERHRRLTRAAHYPVAVSDALDATRS
jgi:nicotinate phosphoribosyltransferase